MKLSELFERREDHEGHDWHQQNVDKSSDKTWCVKDSKQKVIFHQLTHEAAKKVLTNPNFIKKYGRLFVDRMDGAQ
jgi:hypothetical protein